MSEHPILRSLLTVTAASVLVCGSLLLLTSTAPWTRLPIETELSTPDSPRFADTTPDEQAPRELLTASGQAEPDFLSEPDAADDTHTASTQPDAESQLLPEPIELAQSTDADTLSPVEQDLAALDMKLDQETADRVEDIGPDGPSATTKTPDLASAIAAPVEIAVSSPAVPDLPEAAARAHAATDRTADLLTALIARVMAGETTEAATEEVAGMLAALPPAPPVPVASEKTGPAAAEVAGVLADLPAPPPTITTEKTEPAIEMAAGVLVASPPQPAPADTENATAEAERIAVAAGPPPPLPRRKPDMPPEPKVAAAAPAVEATSQPKLAAAASPPREKPAPREAPKQQAATQSGGPLGIWKPMALAPADEPSVPLSKPATARPSGKAYASQVWAQLARHKPRAGQRGAASVSFAIGATGTLGAVRIARSSGNARIDQLALQTVRSAAPFPRPPAGSASYTIRIDFQ